MADFLTVAKYMMKAKTRFYQNSYLEIDGRLAEELDRCGARPTLVEVSIACKKRPTYFYCRRRSGNGMENGSLLFLQAVLARKIGQTSDAALRLTLRAAARAVNAALQEKLALNAAKQGRPSNNQVNAVSSACEDP